MQQEADPGSAAINSAEQLVSKLYSAKGYKVNRSLDRISTFVESVDGQAVGTLSIRVDRCGLQAERLYPTEVQQLRASGRRLCEATRLAVERAAPPAVLASLMNRAMLHCFIVESCDDILIEVNPRHVSFYRRKLGFTVLGEERHCSRVDAPAVLLRVTKESYRLL